MTKTLANGYSSESTRWELSNQYQDDRVYMIFKNIWMCSCSLDESSLSIGRVKTLLYAQLSRWLSLDKLGVVVPVCRDITGYKDSNLWNITATRMSVWLHIVITSISEKELFPNNCISYVGLISLCHFSHIWLWHWSSYFCSITQAEHGRIYRNNIQLTCQGVRKISEGHSLIIAYNCR